MSYIPLINQKNALNKRDATQSENHKDRMPLKTELYIQQNKKTAKQQRHVRGIPTG